MIYQFLKRVINGEVDLGMFCQDTLSLRASGPMKSYLKFYDLFIDRLADDVHRKLDDLILEQQTKELKTEKVSDKRWSRAEIIASIIVALIVLATFILGICNKN